MSSTPFVGAADEYDRFMGRYTIPLARELADAAGIEPDAKLLDIGCGPGGLTLELARRVPAANISAIDPAPQFVEACLERVPGADVRVGSAENLPWGDNSFDAVLCCLVFAFMQDPVKAAHEMSRVTRPGGTVAACMWDISGGGMAMLRIFWSSLRSVTDAAQSDKKLPGTGEGELAGYLEVAGLSGVESGVLTVSASYSDFDDFWEPFTRGVGPTGAALARLGTERQAAVREAAREQVPDGAFTLPARAWLAVGHVA